MISVNFCIISINKFNLYNFTRKIVYIYLLIIQLKKINYEYFLLCPFFNWLSMDTIKLNFCLKTYYTHILMGNILKNHYKSHLSAINIHRHSELVSIDTIYYDIPSVDNSSIPA